MWQRCGQEQRLDDTILCNHCNRIFSWSPNRYGRQNYTWLYPLENQKKNVTFIHDVWFVVIRNQGILKQQGVQTCIWGLRDNGQNARGHDWQRGHQYSNFVSYMENINLLLRTLQFVYILNSYSYRLYPHHMNMYHHKNNVFWRMSGY